MTKFSKESHETPLFVRQLASCSSLDIHFTEFISFFSSISQSIPISILNFYTEQIEYKASGNYQCISKWYNIAIIVTI